ncbi:endo-1,4-beta-xylanase [Lacrimispora algidixylanolytica]|uniref:Beta-xylanase n=1 Tax=Lacrimispora algidixylanolytica TaxID=94868 RepID=A0A419T020_9FIRM|nr:endo-1,4-beta-xylanase [Lacrimispora algidixylanolytica]RKD30796.1 endo-1,4-beta-xylanase [Lacrimispora algidixylanolytica]
MKKSFKRLVTVISAMALTISSLGVTQAATADQNLLNTYGAKYNRSGTCVNLYQLQNQSTLNTIKQRYNSITLENEMKPDALLGGSPTLISVAEAKSLGYYIPSGYTESTVPKINFGTIDKVLKIAYDNGLGVRGHTLVWHGQTPAWLFKTGYNGGAGFVNQTVMNARMEFYIKTVMNHVYSSQYGSVVYAWDVVNEYLHSPSESGWLKIYGNISTSPQFVKDAFRYASETLSYYKLTDKVSLFYNDYNEYMEADNIVKMIKFINAEKKICNGVGGQAHLASTFPSASYFKQAYTKFVNAGFEIQITEFDAGAKSEQEQAAYVYDVMKSVNELKKAGGKFTGFTWWGLSDDTSWRRESSPLLYSNINTPKASYYRTLDAFTDVFNR